MPALLGDSFHSIGLRFGLVEVHGCGLLGRGCVDFLQGSHQVLFSLPEGEPTQLPGQSGVHLGRRRRAEVRGGQRR